jgi:hypothetical protein
MAAPAIVERLYNRDEADRQPLLVMTVETGSLLTTASLVACGGGGAGSGDSIDPELVATQADLLGCSGEAIDQALLYSFLAQHQDAFISQPLTATSKQTLLHKLRAAKEAAFPSGAKGSPRGSLRPAPRKSVDHDLGGGAIVSFTVTEEAVNEAASDTIFRKIGALCSSVIALGANSHRLLEMAGKCLVAEAVVISGGCANMPLLRKFVEDLLIAMALQAGLAASACLRGGVHVAVEGEANGASMLSSSCRALMRGPFTPASTLRSPLSLVSADVCSSALLLALHGDCWGVLLPAGMPYPAVCRKQVCLVDRSSRNARAGGTNPETEARVAVRLMAVAGDHQTVVVGHIEPVVIDIPKPTATTTTAASNVAVGQKQQMVELFLVLDETGSIALSVSHAPSAFVASTVLGPFEALAATSRRVN